MYGSPHDILSGKSMPKTSSRSNEIATTQDILLLRQFIIYLFNFVTGEQLNYF